VLQQLSFSPLTMLQAAWLRGREQLQMCDRERDGAESGRMMDSGLRISDAMGTAHIKEREAAARH
jgi:hypothetical protein